MSRAERSFLRRACASFAAAAFCCAVPTAFAESTASSVATAETAWREILALDTGPGSAARDRAEALALSNAHLHRQTQALEQFLARFPADPRRDQAKVRLAAVKYARARLPGASATGEEADRLLDALEADPATSASGRADARYLRLTESMQRVARLAPASRFEQRAWLLRGVRDFARALPSERRSAGLLVEVGTLFDDDPGQRRAILAEAENLLGPRTDPTAQSLRRRIADDRRRLAWLGKELDAARLFGPEAVLTPGRPAVLFFCASWSAPSLRAAEELRAAQGTIDFELVVVSLDEEQPRARAFLTETGLRAPLVWDGKSWESPAVRSLGLNALPCLLVLDRRHTVHALNAVGRLAETVRAASTR